MLDCSHLLEQLAHAGRISEYRLFSFSALSFAVSCLFLRMDFHPTDVIALHSLSMHIHCYMNGECTNLAGAHADR